MVTERHALARLIDAVKDANAWSDVDVTAVARRHGYDLSKSNISRIRQQNPLVSITAATLQGLSAGLGVSVEQVALAALDSMGIVIARYDAMTPEQAIRRDVDLSARDRAVLLGMLAAMREAPEGASHASRPRPRPSRPPARSGASEPLEGEKTVAPQGHPEDVPGEAGHYGLAGRMGRNEGREMREAWDAAQEAPDPEGPEGGA